jgi:signal transduction histidine kinase
MERIVAPVEVGTVRLAAPALRLLPAWPRGTPARSLSEPMQTVRQLFDPRFYGRIAYLLLALPLGVAEFTLLCTALTTGISLAVVIVGIPILVGSLVAWRWMAGVERRLIGTLLGTPIAPPYRPDAAGSWWDRLRGWLADPATWKDLVFLLLQLPLGIVSFTVTVTIVGVAAGALTAPLGFWAVPGGYELGILQADTLPEALLLVPLGVVATFLGVRAINWGARLYGEYAELLLGSNLDPALNAEVSELRGARARVIEAGDAERRRLERDLHDGAQQRLVSLALTLRLAERQAAGRGDADAEDLVRRAGDEARLAIEELRDLARGIHPAILTNRGLASALEDLASRSGLPVEIVAVPDRRLPDQVEAAAYFIVSESLTNAAKHAGASTAWVSASAANGALRVEVRDDGSGGAAVGSGSGLTGLEDRVEALDGTLEIDSPEGAGTVLRAEIPIEPRRAEGLALPGPLALADAQAQARDERRGHRLRHRLGILGGLASLLVVIWLLTSADSAWIVWPLLGLGAAAALDAWLTLGNPTPRESGLPAGLVERERAFRRAMARRRAMLTIGALGILDLLLVGIWAAAGAGYFWPVWALLATGLAAGQKLLRLSLSRSGP